MNTRKASDWAIARAFWSLMSSSNSGNTVTLLDIASVAEGFDAGVACVKRKGGIKVDASKSQVETFVNTPSDKAIAQALREVDQATRREGRMSVDIERVWNLAREIDAAEPKANNLPMPLTEWQLRKLLAIQVGGMSLYMDDGELQDSSSHPTIDFLRFTPVQIADALCRRDAAVGVSAPAERAEDSDVLAIPRWRCIGYSAETQCAFVVVDENGAWMHKEDVTPLMEEYRRLAAEPRPIDDDLWDQTLKERDEAEEALGDMFQAVTGRSAEWSSAWHYKDAIEEVEDHIGTLAAEQGKDRKDAERWRHARHHAMEQLLTAYPTPDTSDIGLDYAVDAAIAQEAGNGAR